MRTSWLHCVLPSQVTDDANVMLNGFGTVVNSLQMRAKPYLPQFCGIIKWRLNNKNAKLRQQAADLIARIAIVMKVHLPLYPKQYAKSTSSPRLCLLRDVFPLTVILSLLSSYQAGFEVHMLC